MPRFKEQFSLDERVAECGKIRAQFPDKVPVIVEKAKARSDVPDLDKNKFLTPSDLTVGQFVYVIRKRLSLPADKALFIFVNNVLPPTSQLMRELHGQQKDADGFLYVEYSGESTFGSTCGEG